MLLKHGKSGIKYYGATINLWNLTLIFVMVKNFCFMQVPKCLQESQNALLLRHKSLKRRLMLLLSRRKKLYTYVHALAERHNSFRATFEGY
jgi:hypothetical protein